MLLSKIMSKFRTVKSLNHCRSYVNVYPKWKKDFYFDSLQHIHSSSEVKKIVSLKNYIARSPDNSIPISDVSKRGLQFDVKIRVAAFLRQYPAIFEEFVGPNHNLPWFRLTNEALAVHEEELELFENCMDDLTLRMKKLISMSKTKVLPIKIVKAFLWNLGLPNDFTERIPYGCFDVVDLGDGAKGLALKIEEKFESVIQSSAAVSEEPPDFPLFPSKGLRLRAKINDWLAEFQRIPYVSPYDDFSSLNPDSDLAEKRLVGFLHELLALFVDHSAQRRKLLCMKKPFGLPQKFHKAFERHPHIFYLSPRNGTCTAILKEAYRDETAIAKHPMLEVRKKYVKLMEQSRLIIKRKRTNNQNRVMYQ